MPSERVPSDFRKAFWEAVRNHEVIALFAHVNPDPDANGSRHGLALLIQSQFPEKTVIECDERHPLLEEDGPRALAVITDTANGARVNGDSWQRAAQVARLDHHVKVETLGDPEWVNDEMTAASEMVALLAKDSKLPLPREAAQVLLEGLFADTQRLSIRKTGSETFECAAWLVGQGARPDLAVQHLYDCSYKTYTYISRIRSKSRLEGKVLYALMSRNDYLSLGVPFEEAKAHVDALNMVREAQIWVLFTEMDNGLYSASVRSRKIVIRTIAEEYGGGGHDLASGIKNLTAGQVVELINRFVDIAG